MDKHVIIIGGGPAGLMAAETLASAGIKVTIYERKPTHGRKFLLAGRGGLNLTHSEDLPQFIKRYGHAAAFLEPFIQKFPPAGLRAWCEGLGQPTFIGSSGRVFPESFKASTLLRAWNARLEKLGVRILFRREWLGWDDAGKLVFKKTDDGIEEQVKADAVVLAMGGASWPRLGADGGWVNILKRQQIDIAALKPSNCGFCVEWSALFRERFAGSPLKPVTAFFNGASVQGEVMVTANGIEGGAVYALSGALRDAIEAKGDATLALDLRPGVSAEQLRQQLEAPRGSMSFSNFVRRAGGLSPIAASLLRESNPKAPELSPQELTSLIKSLPLRLTAPFSIDRAISSAGGIKLDAVDENLMLKQKPGVFAAGEMLDWEAPTGGYLLQACFSTAVQAAEGVLSWLNK